MSTIEVFARVFGYIQWHCPACTNIHGNTPIPWRRAKIACLRCRHRFIVGVAVNECGSWPPHNGIFADEWRGGAANRLNHSREGAVLLIGRLLGNMELECPSCEKHVPSTSIDFALSAIECKHCAKIYFVAPILYRSAASHLNKPPLDWTPSFFIDRQNSHDENNSVDVDQVVLPAQASSESS